MTVESFSQEIAESVKMYEKFVVCLDKTPDEFEASMISLLNKAMKAFESRGPNLRHGIALDKHVTIILSQSESSKPLCGIYFNLHSPYQKSSAAKVVQPLTEPLDAGSAKSEG